MIEDRLPAVQDHAKLRAPVADVVVSDDLVADEARDACQRVANERAANVADMHRLGDVRRGEINDDALRLFDLRHADMVIFDDRGKPLRQRCGAECEIEEAGAVHGDFLTQILHLKRRLDLLSEGAGIRLELLRQRHRRVALVVAVTRVGSDDDVGQKTFRQLNACRSEGGLKTGCENGAEHGARRLDAERGFAIRSNHEGLSRFLAGETCWWSADF